MAFQIIELLDSKSDRVLAKVSHQDHQLLVTVRDVEAHKLSAGDLFQAEISFDEILGWKVLEDFEDAHSAIRQEQDGIHLLGRVHSILDYGDGRIFIDVYMQSGPEFFTVSLNAAEEEAPDANEGLEIIAGSLYLHPIS